MRKLVNDWLADIGETSLFADGFDDAIIGLSYDPLAGSYRVCYSIGSCHECLMNMGICLLTRPLSILSTTSSVLIWD